MEDTIDYKQKYIKYKTKVDEIVENLKRLGENVNDEDIENIIDSIENDNEYTNFMESTGVDRILNEQKLLTARRYIFKEDHPTLGTSRYLRFNQKHNGPHELIITDEFDYLFDSGYIESINPEFKSSLAKILEDDKSNSDELFKKFNEKCLEQQTDLLCNGELGCEYNGTCKFNAKKAAFMLYNNVSLKEYHELMKKFLTDEIPFNIHHPGPLSTESHRIREFLKIMLDNYFVPFDSQPGMYLNEKYYQKPYIILSSTSDNFKALLGQLYVKNRKNYIKIDSIDKRGSPIDMIDIYFTVENNDWDKPMFFDICNAILEVKSDGLIREIFA